MDAECRWPGSVHDAKVFSNSLIFHKLKNNELPQTFQTLTLGSVQIPNYLIGDPAYPLTPNCMKEFETCIKNEHVLFNNLLRSARNPIECTFGRLKARWSILTRKLDLKLESIPVVVYACFILHNFCEKNDVQLDESLVIAQCKANRGNETNIPDPIYSCNAQEGEVIGNSLVDYIRDNLPDELAA